MTTPTPTKPHPVTLYLRNTADEATGTCEIRLVLTAPGQATDPGASVITHALGSPAGGTHTEVVFVDGTAGNRDLTGDGSFDDPQREELRGTIVRQVANLMYPGTWAFEYRPARVPDAVLRYGSALRERVEVSTVEVWA